VGVVSLVRFRTQPGRLADHLAATAEALGHLRRLGIQAANYQALAGGDVGTITTALNFVSNADYAAGVQKIGADEQWQQFWASASAAASAEQVESSLFADADPNFQPSGDRPLGVVLATQWRAMPGRLTDFMGQLATGLGHISRIGGAPRAMQSLIGAHPLTVLVTVGFADIDAYGAYSDATTTDEQWQTFWAGALANPSAELIRSGLYLDISG
jgi:hypothetical protein